MGPRHGWTHLAHKKGMGSPCLCLTLTQHAIFVEKTGPRGGCVRRGRWTRFACKKVLDSPSLNMTLTHHAFFVREIHMSQMQMCQSDGWACFACKKGLVHLVFV